MSSRLPGRPVEVTLWTLRLEANEATAALRWIEGVGWEVRLYFRGDIRQSRMFKADRAGAEAWAEEWREDLEGNGWT